MNNYIASSDQWEQGNRNENTRKQELNEKGETETTFERHEGHV